MVRAPPSEAASRSPRRAPARSSALSFSPRRASLPGWGKSHYGYAGGNPASAVDPSGLDPATWDDALGVWMDGEGNYWDDAANGWLPLEGSPEGTVGNNDEPPGGVHEAGEDRFVFGEVDALR